MKPDDLWQQFESLSDSDADAVLKAAGADKLYWLKLAGLFVAYVLGIAAFSFAVPAFYRTFHPGIGFKISLALAALAGIWFSVVLLRRVIQRFYYQALAWQLKGVSDGP